MALVVGFSKDDRDLKAAHPTTLVCKYLVGERDGKKILQLNTYGSTGREIPGKLSQTLQLDESAARQLFQVLQREFRF
ncbi:hypothetical protein OU426_11815 [Frigidibacter sp. RF13]|uniref:hypothetical protein n=1 Tax=Frigidibacter sp. RF13 TaxID=2997340 RepID=UPI002270029D|nr:hypothetical protein [Frigidibacter sp. RF13]MCY1127544.1 hypothetical protein [Frigidibacter sp. RF13]